MANQEQLEILKKSVDTWNIWRKNNPATKIDLIQADLVESNLFKANLVGASLSRANINRAKLRNADLESADLGGANLWGADLREANLNKANLRGADLRESNLRGTNLNYTNLYGADFQWANLTEASLKGAEFANASFAETIFGSNDLSEAENIERAKHHGPSILGINTIYLSKGNISDVFLRGCGLSDWEIESVKLYTPERSNEDINKILYKIYDLRASQALQVSPLFISYSHNDSIFVNKLEEYLNKKGVRFWRDTHNAVAGRLENQIDQAIRLNPTVLLILSNHSIRSDWVEHEVRTARELEKEMKRDVLCPIALDDSWKGSPWPKRVMEQVKEYNILNFSEWEDDSQFVGMFRKLIDGLELFYKG